MKFKTQDVNFILPKWHPGLSPCYLLIICGHSLSQGGDKSQNLLYRLWSNRDDKNNFPTQTHDYFIRVSYIQFHECVRHSNLEENISQVACLSAFHGSWSPPGPSLHLIFFCLSSPLDYPWGHWSLWLAGCWFSSR